MEASENPVTHSDEFEDIQVFLRKAKSILKLGAQLMYVVFIKQACYYYFDTSSVLGSKYNQIHGREKISIVESSVM